MKLTFTKKAAQRQDLAPYDSSKQAYDQFEDYERRISQQSFEQEQASKDYSNSEHMIDFENLDIEPIQNTSGDKFVIDETDERDSYSQKSASSKQIEFLESSVWVDVFYAKKSIMHLLQQRNEVCQMYNLNSKSLKQINTTQATKRIYTDLQISQYAKQLFEESPSYFQLDPMCFTVVPQMSSTSEKYFVFMGCDDRFVPLCKSCNLSTYLILNIEAKDKAQMTQSNFGDKPKKSGTIKGKILCSNSKCKKQLLGEFVISQEQKKLNHVSYSRVNTYTSDGGDKMQKIRNPTEQSEQKRLQLSERQKILIKKAVMKVNL